MANERRKYMDVDVIALLEEKMKGNTKHYQGDFEVDKRMFNRYVKNPYKEDKTFLWLSRPNGTECVREYEAFIRDTAAHCHWTYFANTKDPIVAFAVDLTGTKNGVLRGNLYELDYASHAAMVASKAVYPRESINTFEDGFELHVPEGRGSYPYYKGYVDQHGPIVHIKEVPKDKDELAYILAQQKSDRDKMREADLPARKRPLSEQIRSASQKTAHAPVRSEEKKKEEERV